MQREEWPHVPQDLHPHVDRQGHEACALVPDVPRHHPAERHQQAIQGHAQAAQAHALRGPARIGCRVVGEERGIGGGLAMGRPAAMGTIKCIVYSKKNKKKKIFSLLQEIMK